MYLNESKTKDMLISLRPLELEPLPLILNKEQLDRVKSLKDIGLCIDSNLKWKSHLDSIESRMKCEKYLLWRLRSTGVSVIDLNTLIKTGNS